MYHGVIVSLQADTLSLDGVLRGKSLVYCASTSAGKSLVAEVLMIRRILATEKKALLVLPYVALCAEKVGYHLFSANSQFIVWRG